MCRWTLFALLFLGFSSLFVAPLRTIASTTSATNFIQKENQLPGTTSWQLSAPAPEDNQTLHYPAIEGYAWTTSVHAGDSVQFSVSTTSPSFSADIYRIGWYQGKGGRLMESISTLPGSPHAVPPLEARTGLIEAHWPLAFTLKTGKAWVSGMYIVKLTASNGYQSYIPFVLRSPQPADFVFIHAANTDEAYNIWGGTSLYQDDTHTLKAQRAFKVSFDRPFEQDTGAGQFFWWEYPMVRWLEQNDYSVTYLSDVDLQNTPSSLQNYRAILIVGHSEYWSHQMRNALETAVGKGVNLAVFGANTLYWQIRYEPQHTGEQALPDRVIACYKNPPLDPLYGKKNSLVTGEFRYSPVNNPEQPFLGAMYGSWWAPAQGGFPWVVTDASNWVFSDTGLKNGDSLPGLVGYEYDTIDASYPVAQGLQILATSPVVDNAHKHDIANTTLYSADSGARVFDVGTIEWSWGLDSHSTIEGRWTPQTNTLDAFVYNRNGVIGNDSLVNKAAQRITTNILENFRQTIHISQKSGGINLQTLILYAAATFALIYLAYCYWVWRNIKQSATRPERS